MTLVTAQLSVSLDGCYAGPEHTGDGHWIHSAEAAGFFRITRWAADADAWRERQGFAGGESGTAADVIREYFESTGAYVMGRRMADGGEQPWGEVPPFRAPVFVVTHRPREVLRRGGGTSFTYVTDGLESAVRQAREAAGGRNVAIAGGGSTVRQALAAGLLDVLDLQVAPVLLGGGLSLFGPGLGLDPMEGLELEAERVLPGPGVTHLRFRVRGREPLLLDDRGSGGGPVRIRAAAPERMQP